MVKDLYRIKNGRAILNLDVLLTIPEVKIQLTALITALNKRAKNESKRIQ